MPLTLYRRHRKTCEASRPEGTFSGEFEESRRGAKRCSCVIHASGTLSGKFDRKRTGHFRWDEARAIAAQWEAAGAWHGSVPPAEPLAPEIPRGVTTTDATEAYLAKCKNRGIEPATFNKYRTFVKQLRVYCDARGYALIAQLTIADMDRFYAAWKDGTRAKAKKLERLKSFVRFCLKREWLSKDIAEDLDAPEGSSIPAHKTPFTDDELERIFTACDKLLPVSAGPGHRGWSGADVKDFMLLSMYTGLRISDVATFDMTKRLKGNDVFRRIYRVVSGGRRRHCHRSDAVALRRPSPCVGIGHSLRPRHGRGDCATEGLTQRARNGVSQRGGEAFWEDSTREALRYTLPPLYGFRGDGCLRQAAPIFCWRRSHNEAA